MALTKIEKATVKSKFASREAKAKWSKDYLSKVLKDKQTIYTLTTWSGQSSTRVVRVFVARIFNKEMIIDEITPQVAHVLNSNFVNTTKQYGIKVRGGSGFDVVDDMNRAWTGKGFIHRELGM